MNLFLKHFRRKNIIFFVQQKWIGCKRCLYDAILTYKVSPTPFKGNRLLPIQSQPNQSFLIISLIKYYKYWLLGAYKYCLAFGHCNSILTLPRQWSTYWILNQSISAVLFPDHQDVFQSQSVERHLLILTRNGKKTL